MSIPAINQTTRITKEARTMLMNILAGTDVDFHARDAIETWIAERQKWSNTTFGAGLHTTVLLKWIESEMSEIREAPLAVEEWIDVALLALDGACRASACDTGAAPKEAARRVLQTMLVKQALNTTRSSELSTKADKFAGYALAA